MGQDDDYADSIGRDLLASFARALEGRRNERGGIYRAGTGTAMYYVFHAAGLGATPDGRSAGIHFLHRIQRSLRSLCLTKIAV